LSALGRIRQVSVRPTDGDGRAYCGKILTHPAVQIARIQSEKRSQNRRGGGQDICAGRVLPRTHGLFRQGAAGPGGGSADVSHLIISSYVTTLQSWFKAQKKKDVGQLKLLVISQPNTQTQSPLPHATEEVEKLVGAAISGGWSKEDIVHLSGSDATVDRVSSALDKCSWAHFACHGIQDHVFGMKSAFILHDSALELGEIASKRLSSGHFAFLSMCSAASGLQNLPGEAMHLAAGLQFVGYSSVIATMWGISDRDAPKVADHVYRYLFRNGLQGLDPSEAATALNYAVLHLREDPTVTVERWAPFIHLGI